MDLASCNRIQKNGELRRCVDMCRANKAIRRKHYPLSTVEEMLLNIGESAHFSVLDLKSAYHQVLIDERSRELTTFTLSKRLFRYTRLMFSVNCAPEKVQRLMMSILSDCKGAMVFIGNVIVHGRTKSEMNQRLDKVLKRFEELNITLNKEKCLCGLKEITFMGLHVSGNETIWSTVENSVLGTQITVLQF